MRDIERRARAIFFEALERESPEQLLAYVNDACGDDAQLRARVDRLLGAHRDAGEFLCDSSSPFPESEGSVIDDYKLLERIGEGGFGDVYMAEQQEPVRRTVALKIVKLGMDTKQVIGRFEAERQALALMDHPNIAKILDAGATDSGRPYFVMDYVRGIPITQFCDQNELTTKERLAIFIDVCRAVQHAHQKGIIHRDLKPTNVLVTRQDGKPVPKVIDFGIAKATEQRLTEKTHFTEHRQLVGTPEYMSPEQATFCDADVDTRSDIYSLGVLLYELLVGTTPFDAQQLRQRGYDEICRVIRETDAPTPSKRLSTLGDQLGEISRHRHVEPATLRKLLRGDLDWIAMMALERDRSRRYETVHSLARDIERHLSDEPVRARPPSALYQLKKHVRKHRVGVAATVAVFGALVLGLALSEHERRIASAERSRANAERDQARENLQLARQLMSDLIGPATERMLDFPFAQDFRREMLDQARHFHERILQQARDDPESRHELALIHRRLGDLAFHTGQDPRDAYRRSLSILADLMEDSPSHPSYREELSNIHGVLSVWLEMDLRIEEAVEQLRISLRILRDLGAEFPSSDQHRHALLTGSYIMGRQLTTLGDFDEAEKYLQTALTDDRQFSPMHRIRSRKDYALLLQRLARYEEAKRVLQEALQIGEQEIAPGTSPPTPGWQLKIDLLASVHGMIGLTDFYTAQFAEAETHLNHATDLVLSGWELYPQPVSIWREYLLGLWHHYLAEVLTAMERIPEAEQARRQSLAAWESAGTPVPAEFPYGESLAHYRLGELLHGTGRVEEARGQFVQAHAMMEDLVQRRPDESVCHWQLICLLANCPDQAMRDPPRAVNLAKHVLPEGAGHYWRYLSLAQYRSDQWQDAADSIQQAMDLRQGGDAFDWFLLAMAHWQLGQQEEAIQWYTQAQEAIETGKPLFYRYVGAMAVQRLRSEAEMLVGGRIENAVEE